MKRLRLVVAASSFLIFGGYYLLPQRDIPVTNSNIFPYETSAHDRVLSEDATFELEDQKSNDPSQWQERPDNFFYHETILSSGKAQPTNIQQMTKASNLPEPSLPSLLKITESSVPIVKPKTEFEFQKDLELDLPATVMKSFSKNHPHNYDPSSLEQRAYATFMASRNPSIKDPYFLAIHSLIYRVLWSPRSRTATHPFVVFVSTFATQEQRELLAGAGAVVRDLSPLNWTPNVPGTQPRWKDLFAKLNMWNETEFSRILFLDADAFPLVNVDDMFELAPENACVEGRMQLDDFLADGTPLCEPYVFAGVPHDPFSQSNININVGSMVFSPSHTMHQRLVQNYVKTDKYDCMMAEQAFLNWQFGVESAFPARSLAREYGAFFPRENEKGLLKVVHEKLWVGQWAWLKEEWESGWSEMLGFYRGSEFTEERAKDNDSAQAQLSTG
jgi:hypothetical protein